MPARAQELAGDEGTLSHADQPFHVCRRRVSPKCLGMYTFLPYLNIEMATKKHDVWSKSPGILIQSSEAKGFEGGFLTRILC